MGPKRLDSASAWDERIDRVWQLYRSGALAEDTLIPAIDALAAERHAGDAPALFERASARDSVGLEAEAEALYRQALSLGLDHARRARATIQFASTLRLLGRLDESEALLRAELDGGGKALRDEVRAFLALTLAANGKAHEAAGHALAALAPHLSRYNRSAANYAAELLSGRKD
ncbi:MAG: tetratricopeptide repeat protein [Micropepsaceae bacterium]